MDEVESVFAPDEVNVCITPTYQFITFWSHPFLAICYASCEFFIYFQKCLTPFIRRKRLILSILCIIFVLETCQTKNYFFVKNYKQLRKHVAVDAYWLILGILSSIGLGAGLHTFILYLGPFIATVTVAAWECSSLNFPEPPYPREIICPIDPDYLKTTITLWMIYKKIFMNSFMWGLGTAIGETPPYFVARTARLYEGRNSSLNEEFDSLLENDYSELNYVEKIKFITVKLISKLGFWGILVLSSFPNPLFDIAGLTCGHCLVSFRTFFAAIVIGKSIIKVTIQVVFVMLSFSPEHINSLVTYIDKIPLVGKSISRITNSIVRMQKDKFHNRHVKTTCISLMFQAVVTIALIYFIISAVNSLAKAYIIRVGKEIKKKN